MDNFENANEIIIKKEPLDIEFNDTSSDMKFFNELENSSNFPGIKSDNNSMIDFIETTIDNMLVSYQDKKSNQQLIEAKCKLNESQEQRNKRLESARKYAKRRRSNETEEQRNERLQKQRDRIRAIRQARKLDPEFEEMRRKAEAERMKIRRANETPLQRMIRLEKGRMYSRKRRENEQYRKRENEKNRIAHQVKRSDISFRSEERRRERERKKLKRDLEFQQKLPIYNLEICMS